MPGRSCGETQPPRKMRGTKNRTLESKAQRSADGTEEWGLKRRSNQSWLARRESHEAGDRIERHASKVSNFCKLEGSNRYARAPEDMPVFGRLLSTPDCVIFVLDEAPPFFRHVIVK